MTLITVVLAVVLVSVLIAYAVKVACYVISDEYEIDQRMEGIK